MRRVFILIACAACGTACAADPQATKTATPPGEGQTPIGASAPLKPTQGHRASGELSLTADQSGVRIGGTIEGLTPNAEHGFHIHEQGDCSAPDASSAGSHFNPTSQPHGHPKKDAKHLGDMVNLRADAKGTARVDAFIEGAALHTSQPTDLIGKAIVVHAKPDDYSSQPSGNSGDRIACAVIASR